MLKEGNATEAVVYLRESLARLDRGGGSEAGTLEAGVIRHTWQALLFAHKLDEAIIVLDEVVRRFGSSDDAELSKHVAEALVNKALALRMIGGAMSEGEYRLLLDCMGENDQLEPMSIEVLIQLAAEVGSSRALNMILDSRSAELLLPLVTALQQELGLETSVAKEVDEVAKDILSKLQVSKKSIDNAAVPVTGR